MAVMEISVVPLGTSSPSISDYVADCVALLKDEGLRYEVTPMGTQVEGELEALVRVALKMHEAPFRRGAMRVLTTIKIDDRRDRPVTLQGKRQAVLERLRHGGGG